MAKPSQSRTRRKVPARGLPRDRVGLRLAIIWLWLTLYLAAYYFWPLSSAPVGTFTVLRRAHLWLALVLGDETFAGWFEGCRWSSIAERLVILAAAGSILLTAAAAGWICIRTAGIDRRLTTLERFVYSAAAGLNVVSLVTLALGICGIMSVWVFAAAGIATSLLAAWLLIKRMREVSDGDTAATDAQSLSAPQAADQLRLSAGWLWLMAPFVVAILASAMLPPVDFDVREYHLQAPKEFYQAGRIALLPHNVYANMPLGTEMLSLVGMIVAGDWWTGALVGKTLIACFAPLTALALFAAGRRFGSQAAGVLAAVSYVSIPWIALVSTQGLVEGAFAFYLFAALVATLLWRERQRLGEHCPRFLVLAGFLVGGAVSTKYPAVVYCLVPLAGYVVYQSAKTPGVAGSRAGLFTRVARAFCIFLLACGLGCGGWFVKNAVQTGNPTYPLLYSVFDGRTRTSEKDAQWSKAHSPPNYDLADLGRRVAGVAVGSEWLSPLVVPLAVLAFINRPGRKLAFALAGYFAYIFATWWLLTHRIDRFWVPALPLTAMLAGMGGAWSNSKPWRATMAIFMAVGLAFNFVVIAGGQMIDNRYLADLNALRTDPQRVEPWHRFLNEHAADVSGVLLVGDAQPFDLEVPVLYNTVFDDSIFEQLARGRTPEEIRALLNERNVSHIYVSWREINRYRSPGNYGITPFLEPKVFVELVAAGVLEEVPPIADDLGQMFRVRH